MTDREDFGFKWTGNSAGKLGAADPTGAPPCYKNLNHLKEPPKVIYVSTRAKMPSENHWAILLYKTISTPGWDKDDPPEQEPVVEYRAYLDNSTWKDAIRELEISKTPYTAFAANLAKVTVDVKVD
jgi:hypothetical protein